MEFLIDFTLDIPDGTPETEIRDRFEAEAVAAAKLVADGHLRGFGSRRLRPARVDDGGDHAAVPPSERPGPRRPGQRLMNQTTRTMRRCRPRRSPAGLAQDAPDAIAAGAARLR